MKLRIGAKISLGLGAILLLLFILGLMSVLSLQSAKNELEQIDKASQKVDISMQIDREYVAIIAALRGYIAYGEEKYSVQANEGFSKVLQLEDNLLKMARDEKKPEVNKLISDTQKYKEIVVNRLIPTVKEQQAATVSGNLQRAKELDAQATAIGKELVPFAEAIIKFLNTAAEDNKKIMKGNLVAAVKADSELIYTLIIGCLLALVIGAAVSIYLTRMIMKPIRAMLAGTKAYAAGDLRSNVNVLTQDELGELAAALNTMKENLKLVISQIVSSSEQVAASSEELTASAEQSAQATTQVAATITEVAAGAATQATAVDSTASVVEKLSAGIQQAAANANAVSGMADKTATAANEGDKAVDVAISQMMSIEKSVSDSAQVVTKLGERSKEIGQIVDAISGIAGQTNLLALNAAIEAARAGEQGRGFAVVAEEVRKLAEQSQEAAKQIASLITQIQTETDSAVAAMNSGTREVKTGTEVVNTAGKAFKEIVSLIEKVSSQIKEISAAIQQMASGSQQIVTSVRDIDKISKEAAGQTQTVSAATEEQSASMEEIAASSQALAKMAEELQSAVRKFRV